MEMEKKYYGSAICNTMQRAEQDIMHIGRNRQAGTRIRYI